LITATCSTGCTIGSTQLKLTVTSGAGTQGVGRILIDTTTGAISNTIVSMAAGLGAAEAVTVGTPITQSNAWGQLTANVRPSWGNLASPPFSTTQTFSVNNIRGTFDTTHPICLSDQFNDNTISASVTGSGTVTIPAPISRPHASGCICLPRRYVRLLDRSGSKHISIEPLSSDGCRVHFDHYLAGRILPVRGREVRTVKPQWEVD
jgi:hypothetical protein